MKRILLFLLATIGFSSCVTLYFHKDFTYKSDGRYNGIDKHAEVDGYYMCKGRKTVSSIFLYRDGSIARSYGGYSSQQSAEEAMIREKQCPDCSFNWGQYRMLGDTLVAQILYRVEDFRYRVYADTFIVVGGTKLQRLTNGTPGKTKYEFYRSDIRPDSSLADLRTHNWYWTKAYKDSVRYASWHRHK